MATFDDFMKEFNKKIQVNKYKCVQYAINSGYVPIHTITVVDTKDFIKIVRLNRWDDYGFQSYYSIPYEENEKLKIQSYSFEKNDPLYIPLLHLLNGDNELIIDDDEINEIEKKCMKIYIDKEKIRIDFINNLEEDQSLERFYVFIKNIGPDIRSKIDFFNKDTKERLYLFFQEVFNLFIEEYHQITIEEYLLQNNLLTVEESKKYIKKLDYKI